MQFDYAPDYKNYVSDVTRVFPANGKFTPRQREFYTIYLRLYQALMTSIRVHARQRDIIKDAVARWTRIMAAFHFTDPKIKEAAAAVRRALSQQPRQSSLGPYRRHGGARRPHPDADARARAALHDRAGHDIPDEHIGIRLEDMILITETGYENLSALRAGRDRRYREADGRQKGLSDALSPR